MFQTSGLRYEIQLLKSSVVAHFCRGEGVGVTMFSQHFIFLVENCFMDFLKKDCYFAYIIHDKCLKSGEGYSHMNHVNFL